MPKPNLQFGLASAVPKTAKAAWGARMIFPNDLVGDTPSGKSPLQLARLTALAMSNSYELLPNGHEQVTLYEDEFGIIVANPRGSHGYLYVAAWLKDSYIATLDLPDPPQSHDYDDEGNPRRNGVNP